MNTKHTFVFDTNSVISAFLLPKSVSRKAFDEGLLKGILVASPKTFDEFCEVLMRSKFEKYASVKDREQFIVDFKKQLLFKNPTIQINACRDPKDNKFLELAVAANASCIITGDNDLLVLNSFRGIPILNAVDFIKRFEL